jgi:hypothetical protein
MTLKLRKQVSTADTEYGIVLLDEDNGDYWNLNPTGALVVRTLQAGGSVADAAQRLIEEYGVEPDVARRDVDDLVEGLRSAGLVRE